MKLFSIIQLTFRESLAKKTFIAFFGISTLVNLLFIFALNLDIVDGAESYISLFGQEVDHAFRLDQVIYGIESAVAVALFTAGLFMALFATSSLIPSFLEKGSIDLLISKPLSRLQILSGRYLGAVTIVAFNIFYMIIFAWLILSLKTGVWNFGFLLAGVMIVLTYAVLFALMTFLGVTIRSGPFSLMITYLIIFFSPLLLQRENVYALLSSRYYAYFFDGLYHFLPKTSELGNITRLLVQGAEVTSWMPLWTSVIFGILMLTISNIVFSRKNF
jgi:ABC-type transport system involved in multi-copper enzyme maturation permease subunit